MDRLKAIITAPAYVQALKEIELCEKNRPYCLHNMQHFLDVARIAAILNLEQGNSVPKGLIYAAALLHDIGRHRQYQEGIGHHLASKEIAAGILPACGYTRQEADLVLAAIENHRQETKTGGLVRLIYQADKLSRNCFCCSAEPGCDWPGQQKNWEISY